MSWFENWKAPKIPKTKEAATSSRSTRSEDPVWIKCSQCGEILQVQLLKENLNVCSECQFHFRMGAMERVQHLLQPGTFEVMDLDLVSQDPLEFVDVKPYKARLEAAFTATGEKDALVTGVGALGKHRVALACFEFRFLGGSMGAVVGEKLCRLMERALEERLPVIVVCSSGGARMQEGIVSLMQMAKTMAVVSALKEQRLPFITVLADPTTGGVAASFAMVGDVILAEPGALIGFAGPRVIGQTMRQELPEGFQRAEFLLKHGFVDLMMARKDLPEVLCRLLCYFGGSQETPSFSPSRSAASTWSNRDLTKGTSKDSKPALRPSHRTKKEKAGKSAAKAASRSSSSRR